MKNLVTLLSTSLLWAISLRADGPADNLPDKVRPVPPPGVKIADAARAELTEGVAALGKEIESLRAVLKGKPALLELLPDVQIYHKAVDWALRYDEFYQSNQVNTARNFLKQGMERAAALRDGKAPWNAVTGLVARGYLSKIDGSVQPYGMVVPPGFVPGGAPLRLDFWIHGRGETLSELSFIDGAQKNPGQFTPPNTLVLHLYGRYCCANKLAGEIDLFEALEDAKRHYPVDESRLVVRGFSMGGAGCWQFAVHYPGVFCAAAPGAGFSETADFLKVFQNEAVKPAWFEQRLWHVYDCTDYAVNLFNLPTVAYSGEIDRQKQAADMMAKALKAEGMELTHIIGPKTAHAYEKNAKIEVSRRIDAIAGKGRDPLPEHVRFTTWTLRYHQSHWVIVDGLEQHWERARVDADINDEDDSFRVTTKNVSALTLTISSGRYPFPVNQKAKVVLDGTKLEAPLPETDRSWTAHFSKTGKKWSLIEDSAFRTPHSAFEKRHGLQGPIDDAFMDSFLMVKPTGQPLNEKAGKWAALEMAHAIDHWRKQYRGEARVKSDAEVSDEDIAAHNLVLWGDPQSNKLLARIADKLPIKWNSQSVQVGAQTFGADNHVPVMIYPNPLNPERYVVLNSGFTFREYDYLNNARQVPKLPDWAVVDVSQPVTSRWPGGIASAGFFGERWEVLSAGK
jgi:pimeloyl-ACP methyl ester carboxylesterase